MAIYKIENEYVISSQHVWLPGVYDTERAAKYAFKFQDEDLRKLQDKKGKESITFEDLQELRKEIQRKK